MEQRPKEPDWQFDRESGAITGGSDLKLITGMLPLPII